VSFVSSVPKGASASDIFMMVKDHDWASSARHRAGGQANAGGN